MRNFAGYVRRYFLLLLLGASIVLAGCAQTQQAKQTKQAKSDPVTTWLQNNAIPLKTFLPGGSDTDLQPLQRIVGNASIVGLGEETHGTHEFFEMKARLAEYLITHMGFTTFIMENNWGDSQLVDAYINGGQQDIGDVMQLGLFGSWQTHEYRDMLEWMRAYNADPSHTTKLHFMGMDIQGVSQSDFTAVENFVQSVDPQQVAQVNQIYTKIASDSINLYNYYRLDPATMQKYQQQAQQVYDLLHSHQQVYQQRSSEQAFALALQNARIIVQFLTYTNGGGQTQLASFVQRDSFMAENVEWIHDHAAGNSPKIIVWAHDGHIADDTSYMSELGGSGYTNFGDILRQRYHTAYLTIGTATYQGSYTTYPSFTSVGVAHIGPPKSDTYNYTLGSITSPIYLLDMRATPPGPVTTWAEGPKLLLEYGLGGEDLSPMGSLQQLFDCIVFIRNTTPSQPLLG